MRTADRYNTLIDGMVVCRLHGMTFARIAGASTIWDSRCVCAPTNISIDIAGQITVVAAACACCGCDGCGGSCDGVSENDDDFRRSVMTMLILLLMLMLMHTCINDLLASQPVQGAGAVGLGSAA